MPSEPIERSVPCKEFHEIFASYDKSARVRVDMTHHCGGLTKVGLIETATSRLIWTRILSGTASYDLPANHYLALYCEGDEAACEIRLTDLSE